MEEIVIKFSFDTGEAKVEAKGFKGPSCKKATEFLEETLGESSDFQKKKEWYETNMKVSGGINSNLCG
jgi:hypothetical protein